MRIFAALFACSLPIAALLSGCTSAGKCRRGEIGCACTLDETCNGGAECNSDKMCVEGTGGTDSGSKKDAGSKTDAGAKKDAGSKSDAGNKTDAGKTDAGKTDAGHRRTDAGPVDCPGDTFAAACTGFCNAFCQNEELLCVGSMCAANQCDPGGMLYKVCAQTCGTDTKCVQNLCLNEGTRTCESFGFTDKSTNVYQAGCFDDDPNCVLNEDFGCSDTCGSLSNGTGGDLAGNGKCEDGGGTAPATCPRGTDCTDCGPRTCSKTLGDCNSNGDCCGYYSDKSLCVTADPTMPGQCLATCADTMTCADSSQTCRMATNDKGKTFYVCAP